MEIKKMEAAIEAILFTMGNSVELTQIADAAGQGNNTEDPPEYDGPLSAGRPRYSDHRT